MSNIVNSLEIEIQGMRARGQELEIILSFLRKNGLSQIESIKAIMALEGISLAKAKQIVHFSQTWQDSRNASEKWHEELEKIVEETC